MASVACAYKQTLCEQRIRILCLWKTIWFFRSSVQEKKNQTLILNYCILTLCLSIFCLCIEVIYQTIIWKVNLCWNTYILGLLHAIEEIIVWTSHFYNATLLNLQQSLFPFMFSNVYSKFLNIIYFKRKNEGMQPFSFNQVHDVLVIDLCH